MAAKFDNIDDVNSKFAGTICLHEKKPVLVKGAVHDPEVKGGFMLQANSLTGRGKYVKLDDPLLNYKDFNIGYANGGQYAIWWYRRPGKQYRQGLKKDQFNWRGSTPGAMPEEPFGLTKSFSKMLENIYPSLDDCQQVLVDKLAYVVAFHKDFALSWDEIHGDYFLEYRGKRIGNSIGSDVLNYRLLDDYKHLTEALKEALPNVHG